MVLETVYTDDAISKPENINSLPTELLISIFLQCTKNEALGSLTTRAVCRRWNIVTDSTPILWRRIFLDNSKETISHLHQQAFLYLERSQPFLIDVEVRTHDPDRVLAILSPLLPSVSRWRSFCVSGFRTEHIYMTDLPTSSTALAPLVLDRLLLTLHDYDPDELDEDDEDSPFATRHPMFTSDAVMQLWVSHLPFSDQLVPLHFTHITISEGPLEGTQTNVPAILDLLHACPSLRVFILEGWQHDDEPLPYDSPLPIVSALDLEVLHIRNTCIARRLLSSLSAPRLRTLILAYLNVDFRVQSAEPSGDDGDSDDEAHDFSQSPWSDHATGMGLRSLISRCHPPLRVIEMDYSDMRTKDFRWVFDHLPDLEEFRIVASDMSDKVISLLKPVHQKDGTAKLRVPKLRKLELSHCQRLSGDTVARSILSRTIFTDTTSDTHLFNKFTDVIISGCEKVDPDHELLLARALGRRFRT